MKDLGVAKLFVGIGVVRDRIQRTIALHQNRYLTNILKLLNMHEANGLFVPLDPTSRLCSRGGDATKTDADDSAADIQEDQKRVGKLVYAMLGTRPDLAYAVSTLGLFNADPSYTHAGAVKRTLRYLRRTQQHVLFYGGLDGGGLDRGLIGYCDSDWASGPDTRRSTTGYVFNLAGAKISWKSRRQPTVARSST